MEMKPVLGNTLGNKGLVQLFREDYNSLGEKSKKAFWKVMRWRIPVNFILGALLAIPTIGITLGGDISKAPLAMLVGTPLLLGLTTLVAWSYWQASMIAMTLKNRERYLAEKADYESGKRRMPPVGREWLFDRF